VLSSNIPDLVHAAPTRTLRLIADLLETAIRIHAEGQHEKGEDYSWIWRPNVEFNHLDSYMESLVSAARDAALSMSSSSEMTATAASFLWSRKWRVFRRLAAHVLRASPTSTIKQIEEMLTDSLEYEEFPGRSPEFDNLLTHYFSALSENGKAKVLSLVERGPDLSGFKKRKESEGKAATEEEVAEIADNWRLKWLHRIRADLPHDWRAKYEALVTRFGRPFDGAANTGVHSYVGPTSPKSSEELQEMSGDALIAFLQIWQSTGEWNAPTPEGLGRSLSAMLATEPQRVAKNAALLRGLNPTYIRSAIDGFTAAAKNRKLFDWAQVIELCEWAVMQGNEAKSFEASGAGSDPDWNWTRKSIGWFLLEALKLEGDVALPVSYREPIWNILEALASDPVAAAERSYTKGTFVGSMSLNVTRGVALDGMIQYARWLHQQVAMPRNHERTLDSILELKGTLEEHFATDKSVVAREVFGRNFPTLFWLDKKWAINFADAIFGDTELGAVAWANYLLFSPAYSELLPVLVPHYRKAIDEIGSGFRKELEDIDRRLAEHLVTFYWRGEVDITSDDGLLDAFFSTAPAGFRSHAIEFIGRSLRQTEPVEPGILERLKKLWDWRMRELTTHRCDGEAIPFGTWFSSGQFDLDWSVNHLLAVLRLCHKAELDFWVVEELARIAHERPAEAVQAIGMMVEGDQDGWAMHGWGDHPRTVLQTALRSSNERAQEAARRVIHLLGSRGWYGYRDLLRPGSPSEFSI
jgi:hypothetical protein